MTSEGKSTAREPLISYNLDHVSSIYKLHSGDLKELFEESNLKSSEYHGGQTKSLQLLRKYGYGPGILKKLATEAETGIIGDKRDIKRRKLFFGKNTKPLAQIPPLKESIKEALDDRILMSLGIAAFLTIITGMVAQGPKWGWIEGVSIYLAIFIIVTLTSLNDWVKDRQFVKL